jgi:hypothetical protein
LRPHTIVAGLKHLHRKSGLLHHGDPVFAAAATGIFPDVHGNALRRCGHASQWQHQCTHEPKAAAGACACMHLSDSFAFVETANGVCDHGVDCDMTATLLFCHLISTELKTSSGQING